MDEIFTVQLNVYTHNLKSHTNNSLMLLLIKYFLKLMYLKESEKSSKKREMVKISPWQLAKIGFKESAQIAAFSHDSQRRQLQ